MDAIEDYLSYLARHGRKAKTLRTYRTALNHADAILRAAGLPTDPFQADERTYLAVRNAPGLAETSRKTYASIYAAFVRWRTGRDLIAEADPLPQRPEPLTRRWITEPQYRILWNAADPMERVILAFGAWMGLRRAEIATVRWSDISGGRLIVHGKGHGIDGKMVSMLIPDAVSRTLETWTRYAPKGAETIIATTDRWTGEPRPVSPDTVGCIVHALGKSVGIDVSTHSLRRLFACELNEREVGPIEIAQLMRHESINTTYRCYLNPNRNRLDGIAAMMGTGY